MENEVLDCIEAIASRDLLLLLLQQTFGSKVEVVASEIGNQHHDYLVLLLQLRYPALKVVVKLAGPEAPLASPFDRTAMLHRLVATRTTIPMPEILAVNMSYEAWPWRYLIKTLVPGQEWAVLQPQMNQAELADAYRRMGESVAQLHSIHFPIFGEFAVDGSVTGGAAYLPILMDHARSVIKSDRLREWFFLALEKQRSLFLNVHQPSLCHEDLHKHNILFHWQQGQWRVATILDFDKAWAGHHETDLARLDLWKGMVSQAFWEAYETIYPIDPAYSQRRLVHQLLWCLEYARSTADHLADTRYVCAELGLPYFEGFADGD